jgi:hypothetical protein
MPSEFDDETALGLMEALTHIDAIETMRVARGISIAFGDANTTASAVYGITGSPTLAQRAELAAKMAEAQRNNQRGGL